MSNISNSAKEFINLQLNEEIINWKAISDIAILVQKFNDEIAELKEFKIQEIIGKNVKKDLNMIDNYMNLS